MEEGESEAAGDVLRDGADSTSSVRSITAGGTGEGAADAEASLEVERLVGMAGLRKSKPSPVNRACGGGRPRERRLREA